MKDGKKYPVGMASRAWGGDGKHIDPDFGRGYGWKNRLRPWRTVTIEGRYFMNALRWLLVLICLITAGTGSAAEQKDDALLQKIGMQKGICVFLGLPEDGKQHAVVKLAENSDLMIYVQCSAEKDVRAVREAAEATGLLGKKIWVDHGSYSQIQMASNLADTIFAGSSAGGPMKKEVLRVLRPEGKAFFGNETLVKPTPEGVDSWSHPYHSPDNNPLSTDKVARHPYLTQYMAEPMFGCISMVTVAAGGRVFMAFGHKAMRKIHNRVLNTLYGINAYNGTILWKRQLRKGFMIHRNTMIATPDTLYLGDDESCKLIDTRTGKLKSEIKPAVDQAGGTVWKWIALNKGILYAMVGGAEIKVPVWQSKNAGFGHWVWGMWKGYDYKDPETAFGFGRSMLAIDVGTREVLWSHRADAHLDGRAVCMSNGRIYCYSPGKFLTCLDAGSGKEIWKTSDKGLLAAIGPHRKAQHFINGFSTSTYMKCSAKHLFFAGPQCENLVVVSAADGSRLWEKLGGANRKDRYRRSQAGNVQLVLRDDAVYAVGGQFAKSLKLDYDTGKILAEFKGRRACTRATGSVDSIFFRASGGTMKFVPSSNAIEYIAPIRPPCHDGVVIADGLLHWGPWICGCYISLYGHICLAPAGEFNFDWKADEKQQLEIVPAAGDTSSVSGNAAEDTFTFKAGADGIIRALDPESGKTVWKAYTGGGIRFQPVRWNGRVFVGSNDGRVYAFEAATGRLLWRFRTAPRVRRIPVYNSLSSTWPVAGGVVVDEGIVYAAAGIAHYDGTHVYALDAVTGGIKWYNGSSGRLNPKTGAGVSLQGMLKITRRVDGEKLLHFTGGNAVKTATFDLDTGKCIFKWLPGISGKAASTFYLDEYLNRQKNTDAEKERQ